MQLTVNGIDTFVATGGRDFDTSLPALWRLSDPVAEGVVGDVRAHRGPRVRPRRLVDRGQACRAFPQKGPPTPEPGAARPQVGRRDGGLREQATTAEHGHRLRVDRGVFGLPAMEGVQGQRMPEDKRHPFSGPEVGTPVPGEEACHGHDALVPVGCESLAHGLWSRWPLPLDAERAILVEDTELQGASRQGDTTGKWMLLGVESPEVSSSCACLFSKLSIPRRYAEEGASISIIAVEPTANSVRSCVAPAVRRA